MIDQIKSGGRGGVGGVGVGDEGGKEDKKKRMSEKSEEEKVTFFRIQYSRSQPCCASRCSTNAFYHF